MNWFPKNRVVVPVDFSDESFEAVEVGLSLVDDPSHLHVINVTPEVVSGDPGFAWNAMEKATRQEQLTKALTERLSDAIQQGLKIEILFGDPGTDIARFAEDNAAELIVMPSHGRTGIKRILIGSVAERVTRLAHCPVLILRK